MDIAGCLQAVLGDVCQGLSVALCFVLLAIHRYSQATPLPTHHDRGAVFSSMLCCLLGCCCLALLPSFGRGADTVAWLCAPDPLTMSFLPTRPKITTQASTTTPSTERGGRGRAWSIKDSRKKARQHSSLIPAAKRQKSCLVNQGQQGEDKTRWSQSMW
jgi:hypothetical protein